MTDSAKKSATHETGEHDPLRRRKADGVDELATDPHIYRKHVCITDSRGFPTYHNLDPARIRVDATDGFIPLWAEGVTLRWRFQERGIRQYFADPEAAKTTIQALFGDAMAAWDDAAP